MRFFVVIMILQGRVAALVQTDRADTAHGRGGRRISTLTGPKSRCKGPNHRATTVEPAVEPQDCSTPHQSCHRSSNVSARTQNAIAFTPDPIDFIEVFCKGCNSRTEKHGEFSGIG
jgi:hypothetical protein